jgi:histidinol-phosphatase (PHP family)
MLTDLHLHLRPDEPGTDAEQYFTAANAERYRTVATERGISELGVSEHIHRFREALQIWQHPFWREQARDDIEAYAGFVREETDLRLGIEADFIGGREDRIANLLDPLELDYVVGSVHFLRDAAVDHDGWDVWEGARNAEEVWSRYFRTLAEAASCGLFDILAHPDLVKVWGPRRPLPEGDLRRFYEPAVEAIAESGIAVEVSTAGLRKPVGEIYPAPAFLAMCLEAGAPIALSSDAHRPHEVGDRYEEALELLDSLDVHELCVFERRNRRLEPIGAQR